MKYVSYFLAWSAVVFSGSFYYKFFWDVFFDTYYQKSEAMVYGFAPAGLPPFNWKINLLIWISGIVMMGLIFGLVMDWVCKSQYKKRKAMPLPVILINQLLAMTLYVLVGVLTDYYERLYYMPIFLLEIILDVFPSLSFGDTSLRLFWLTVLHGEVFSLIALGFYFGEKKRCDRILRREEEFRREREAEGEELEAHLEKIG